MLSPFEKLSKKPKRENEGHKNHRNHPGCAVPDISHLTLQNSGLEYLAI